MPRPTTDMDAPEMDLAVTLRVRNGILVRHRLEHGLTQKQAAELAGVRLDVWGAVECLAFYRVGSMDSVVKMAEYLEVDPEELVPESLRGERLALQRTLFTRQKLALAADQGTIERLTLPNPAEEAADRDQKEGRADAIDRALSTLSFREREIIKLRFGLGDPEGHTFTLREVADIFKVTRERVRQTEAKAIRKLQHPVRANSLVPYVKCQDG